MERNLVTVTLCIASGEPRLHVGCVKLNQNEVKFILLKRHHI